ncbi:MAG TPA: RnfABCDGE type electron transport complex subunit D [Candidatus Dormibacteraeota bacterium]
MLARPKAWLHSGAAWLDRAAFSPASLPDDLISAIALAPAIAAGLTLFRLPALEMLLVAVGMGLAGTLFTRFVWRHDIPRPQPSPLIAAIVGVALVGPGSSLGITIAIAAAAVILELLRARYVPAIRAQTGLLAFAGLAVVSGGAPLVYVNPASHRSFFPDPIALWFAQPALPGSYDPVTLYVGNVAGPVFATSLLAVGIGIAWLAYARRLSFAVALGFLAGAGFAIVAYHWDYIVHLDSAPTWFVAMLLADKRYLPTAVTIRPVLGFSAGLLTVAMRARGYGIEAAFLTAAGVQAVMAVLVVVLWAATFGSERMQRNRRLRQREANLRIVKT